MSPEVSDAARELVSLEAWLLDQRDWDAWLGLYAEDAEYWLPCWEDEYILTKNPNTEVSLIYYNSRAGLEDRALSRIDSAATHLSHGQCRHGNREHRR